MGRKRKRVPRDDVSSVTSSEQVLRASSTSEVQVKTAMSGASPGQEATCTGEEAPPRNAANERERARMRVRSATRR